MLIGLCPDLIFMSSTDMSYVLFFKSVIRKESFLAPGIFIYLSKAQPTTSIDPGVSPAIYNSDLSLYFWSHKTETLVIWNVKVKDNNFSSRSVIQLKAREVAVQFSQTLGNIVLLHVQYPSCLVRCVSLLWFIHLYTNS